MKTCRLFLIYSVFVGFMLTSCEKQERSIYNQNIDYEYLGKIHNQGLNEILNELQTTRAQSDGTLSDLSPQTRTEVIKKSALDFVSKNDVPQEVIDFTEVQLDKLLIINENRNNSYIISENIFPEDFDKSQSPLLTSKLEILNDIISDNDLDINSLLSRITALENSALSILSEEDLSVLLCATATAKYSLQYWNETIYEWAALCGVTTRAQFNWKQVGTEDIKGGIAGATALGFARFFGPIGWKAWLIGIGGSALGASAADAVGQLIGML